MKLMIRMVFASLMVSVALVSLAADAGSETHERAMCDVGPARVTLGDGLWLVYSCPDERTLVLLAEPGSKASPAYLMVYPQADGTYRIAGEGTGDDDAVKSALLQLQTLHKAGFQDLRDAAKAANRAHRGTH